MKKFREFLKRLGTAWMILIGRRGYCLWFSDGNISWSHVYRSAAIDAFDKYMKLVYKDKDEEDNSFIARAQIVRWLLSYDTNNSILAQFKDFRGDCYVSYDCNSENDLKELLEQDIRGDEGTDNIE